MIRRNVTIACIAALIVWIFGYVPMHAKGEFIELTVRIEMDPKDDERVNGKIVSIDAYPRSEAVNARRLQVNCPFGDGYHWKHTFKVGDPIPVETVWKVGGGSTRGKILSRGSGSNVSLVISQGGAPVRCTCADKSGSRSKNLRGVFVWGGATTRELVFKGKKTSILGTIFFRKGEDRVKAYADKNGECTFKIRCSWNNPGEREDCIFMPEPEQKKDKKSRGSRRPRKRWRP